MQSATVSPGLLSLAHTPLRAEGVRAAAVPRATGVIQSWFPAVLGSAETLIGHDQDSGARGSSATEGRCALGSGGHVTANMSHNTFQHVTDKVVTVP